MGNMSYCRFENTASDLHDCVDALESGDVPDSESELGALERMRGLCKRFLAAYKEHKDTITEAKRDLLRDALRDDEEDDDA